MEKGQNAPAKLDTYNPGPTEFSEHYGQIPAGLALPRWFSPPKTNLEIEIQVLKHTSCCRGDVYTFAMWARLT
jgi:hypothetical protein